jgi:hypothetical protein
MFRLDALVTGRITGLSATDDPGPLTGSSVAVSGRIAWTAEEVAMATTTARPQGTKETGQETRLDAARGVVADAAAAAGSLATDARTRLPGAAVTARAAFDDANLRIRASSDEMLRLGTTISFGLAVGLLIAGASRILVAAALVPVGMMGLAMLERWSGSSRDTDRSGVPGGL